MRTIRLRIPHAREVFLLGDFNNWSTVATPLRHIGGWMWEATVPAGSAMKQMAVFVIEQGQAVGRLCRLDETGEPTMA